MKNTVLQLYGLTKTDDLQIRSVLICTFKICSLNSADIAQHTFKLIYFQNLSKIFQYSQSITRLFYDERNLI
jgi:hypothetical protein